MATQEDRTKEEYVYVVVSIKAGIPVSFEWFTKKEYAHDWITEQGLSPALTKTLRVVPATLTFDMPKG